MTVIRDEIEVKIRIRRNETRLKEKGSKGMKIRCGVDDWLVMYSGRIQRDALMIINRASYGESKNMLDP